MLGSTWQWFFLSSFVGLFERGAVSSCRSIFFVSRFPLMWLLVRVASPFPSVGGEMEYEYDDGMTKFDFFSGMFLQLGFEEGFSAYPVSADGLPVFSESHDEVDTFDGVREGSFPVLMGVGSFVLTLLAAIQCWLVGATPSVSLPGLDFDRWWKHPLVFQSFMLAAQIKAFAGKRKGKMLGKGLSYFGPWVWTHFVVPQVVAAGCAAAAVVVMDWYFQDISSLSAAAILARALISFFAMLSFDVSGTEVVSSFLHGLLREGHVLGLRFGRALAAAAFFAAGCSPVLQLHCSRVCWCLHTRRCLCVVTVMADTVAVWLLQQAAAACFAFGCFHNSWHGQGCFQVYCGCATGVSVRL